MGAELHNNFGQIVHHAAMSLGTGVKTGKVTGKRGDYQNCSVLYCVLKLCTVISTLR